MNPELRRQIDQWIAEGLSEDEVVRRVQAMELPAPGTGERAERPGPVRNALKGVLKTVRSLAVPATADPATAASIMHGATFGLSDELLGTAGGWLSGKGGQAGRDVARAQLARAREEQPVMSTVNEIIGGGGTGALLGLASAPLLAGTAIGQRVAQLPMLTRTIGGGAVGGAVGGAAEAEGGLRERAGGAAWGTALGAALPVGFTAAGGVGRGARGLVRAGLDVAGVTPQTTPTNPILRAILPLSAEERARQVAARVLERSGRTAEELAARAAENPNFMLTDVGGRATQRLARTVGTVPSRGSEQVGEALTRRQEGQSARLSEAVQRRTGLMREDAPTLTRDIEAQQQELARPHYEAAHRARVRSGELLAPLAEEEALRDAWERAARAARRDGVRVPNIFREMPDGTVQILDRSVPVMAIDYMKRALDDVLQTRSIGPNSLGRHEARQIRDILNDIQRQTEDQVEDLRIARGIWSGGEREKEAAELGARFLSQTPAEAAREMADLTVGERMIARRAAIDQVLLRLEGSGDTGDATRKIAGNPLIRQRLRLLFDTDDQMADMIRDIEQERLMGSSFNLFRGGSNTVDKAQDLADIMGLDIGDVVETGGSPAALLARGLGGRARALQQGVNERVANAVAPMLTTQGPELQRLLGQLNLTREQQQAWAGAVRRATQATAQTGARRGAGAMQQGGVPATGGPAWTAPATPAAPNLNALRQQILADPDLTPEERADLLAQLGG
jgi:hypothetical protein